MKKLLLTCAAALMAVGAWAAGYNRTLSESIEVSGYEFKAFYDFQNNDPEVLPTSGDLRYREGGIWGLHNFGSGTRSAVVNIEVEATDLIILQDYNGTATISGCTANAAASTATGYLCFDVATAATSITISTPRYGGVVAAVVMSKDNDATEANYTVVCKCGDTELSSTTTSGVVGSVPVFTKNPIWFESVKYIYVSDDLGDKTIAADGSTVVTLQYRLAETFTYDIHSSVPGVSYTGSNFEGEVVTVAVPRYINNAGTLYEIAKNGNDWYHYSYTLNSNVNETLTYDATDIANVVFYSEAEALAGATSGNGNGSRTSMGLTAYGIDLPVTTLAPGSYKISIHGANGNSAARAVAFKNGEDAVAEFTLVGSSNYQDYTSEVFALTESADITLTSEGSQASGVDYFFIQQTAAPVTISAAGWATYVAPCALDFTDNAIEAYAVSAVSATSVTLTQLTTVPAGEAIIVKGATGNVPVAASAAPITNLLVAATAPVTATGSEYVLAKQEDNVVFAPVKAGVEIPAGKAYLENLSGAASLRIEIEGMEDGYQTAISLTPSLTEGEGACYDLYGRKSNGKGLMIQNGKVVLVK